MWCLMSYGPKVAAMFKIGNSKELPAIPEHLSDEGKDFVRKCLQREPRSRPTAAELLEHPFVKDAAPLEKPNIFPASFNPPCAAANGVKPLVHYLFILIFLLLLRHLGDFCYETGILAPHYTFVKCFYVFLLLFLTHKQLSKIN